MITNKLFFPVKAFDPGLKLLEAPSMFSISTSVLRKSRDFLIVDLFPLRQINADLSSANEVLARIHEIVL